MTNVQPNNGIMAQGAGDAVINLTKLRDANDELEIAISLMDYGVCEDAIRCFSELVEDYQKKENNDVYLVASASTSLLQFYSNIRYVRERIEDAMKCIKLVKGGEQ